MNKAESTAWRDLEARFTRALAVWGFTPGEDEARPYARAIVRNLRADGWRAPLPPGYRVPHRPPVEHRATPDRVTAYAAQARAQIRRHREAVQG